MKIILGRESRLEILKLRLVNILRVGLSRNADIWLRFWSCCLVDIMKMKSDQDSMRTCDYGNHNSTLGSVVPLAMFKRKEFSYKDRALTHKVVKSCISMWKYQCFQVLHPWWQSPLRCGRLTATFVETWITLMGFLSIWDFIWTFIPIILFETFVEIRTCVMGLNCMWDFMLKLSLIIFHFVWQLFADKCRQISP